MNETSKKTMQPSVEWLTVDESSDGQRLDNFLIKTCKGVPKSHLYRMVRTGEVRVNKGRAKISTRLQSGDIIRIPPIRINPSDTTEAFETQQNQKASRFVPTVIFEDDTLIAIDKPAGIAVHGGSGISLGVIEALRRTRPAEKFLELVHRLDRETSGLLLIAKKRRVLLALHEALREGAVDKRYLALVEGRLSKPRQTIQSPLYTHRLSNGERRVRVDPAGKPAVTAIKVLGLYEGIQGECTLVEASPKTGRTHQIRVHLASIGHRIIGDDKYGHYESNHQWSRAGHKRMFLHAAELTFQHPESGEVLHLSAPLPAELAAYLNKPLVTKKGR